MPEIYLRFALESTVKDMETGEQVQVDVTDFPGDHDRPTVEDVG